MLWILLGLCVNAFSRFCSGKSWRWEFASGTESNQGTNRKRKVSAHSGKKTFVASTIFSTLIMLKSDDWWADERTKQRLIKVMVIR